jgi:hypothetical protein
LTSRPRAFSCTGFLVLEGELLMLNEASVSVEEMTLLLTKARQEFTDHQPAPFTEQKQCHKGQPRLRGWELHPSRLC